MVKNRKTGTTAAKALVDVKVGDEVMSVNHKREKRFAKVKKLPHSRSFGDFIEINLSPTTTVEGVTADNNLAPNNNKKAQVKHAMSLRTTEHHTFPKCGGAPVPPQHLRHSKAGKSQHLEAALMMRAHELKPGGCLLTLDGEQTIESVHRTPAKSEDLTYSVQLEGTTDLIAVGGVVTHAQALHVPSMAWAKSGLASLSSPGATRSRHSAISSTVKAQAEKQEPPAEQAA
jgi:hypothetical protein